MFGLAKNYQAAATTGGGAIGRRHRPGGLGFTSSNDGPSTLNIPLAIKNDLEQQGAGKGVNTERLARAVMRSVRRVDDGVFKAAGVDPKLHRENFEKIIDEIMKGL